METNPITAILTTTYAAPNEWFMQLHTPDGALVDVVGTSADEGDSDEPSDWVEAWAERVGYEVLSFTGRRYELRPAPPAKWTLESRDDAGRFVLLTVERFQDDPTSALGLAEDVLLGEDDGEYRITTYSTEGSMMDRETVEVYSRGSKVERLDG